MTANPTCGPDTIDIPGFSDPIPRLLYAEFTNVSGCSEFDGKVVQILYDSVSGNWLSDDDDLVVDFGFSPSIRSMGSECVGYDVSAFGEFGTYTTPVDETFTGQSLSCCGTVDIHVGELP